MLTKDQKSELVKKLADKIKAAKATIFVDYKNLKVKDVTDLKKTLRKSDVEYVVAKKTLIDIALKNAGIKDVNTKSMEGQIALSFSNKDEVVGAKIINDFAKTNENIKMLGCLLGAEFMNATQVKALAKLPSKEELLAKLVGTLNAPVSGFVNVLAGNLRGLVNALKAVSENKQ